MIRLLNGRSLNVKDTFPAEKLALNLTERNSTATVTLGPEAPAVNAGDWLTVENGPGSGIVWRVKSVSTDYGTNTRTLNCEHMITALKDMILFGDTAPGDMAGDKKAKECTAAQAVTYILSKSADWTFGSVGYTKSAPYSFNGDDLLSAVETVSSSLFDAWWSYDFSSYPFKLHIKPKSQTVACEMRTDRNIRTLRKVIDRTRMFTRFYPIGKNNIKLPGEYVSKNENLYGTVCKVETDQSKDTEEKLRAWANERLNNHAEPIVTVTVSGLDLSDATGEPLDRLTLGTVCRVPLPEFGTTLTERIVTLNYGDAVNDPNSVNVTLANQVEDVATIVNSLAKGGGGGGRTDAKNAEEDHAWFVDTTDHVAMVAEAVAGEGASKDWSRVSEVLVDGEGIHQRVTKAEGDIIAAEARIEVNENQIMLEVKRAQDKEGELRSSIDVQAGKIELKVSKGDVISSINQSPESVSINASRINLTGYVTASQLETVDGRITNLTNGNTLAGTIKTNALSASSSFSLKGKTHNNSNITIEGTTYNIVTWN